MKRGRTLWVLVALGLVTSTLSLLFLAKIAVTYWRIEEVGHARQPLLIADRPPTFQGAWDAAIIGNDAIGVWYLLPSQGAPLPPGVTAWPAPGEAVVSPAVADLVDAEKYLGRIVGEIGAAGLAMKSERIAYVVPLPAAMITDQFAGYNSFGAPFAMPFGVVLSMAVLPPVMTMAFALLLLVAPVLALVTSIRHLDPLRRRQEEELLRIFGMSGWGIAAWNVRQARAGIAAGIALAIVTGAGLIGTDFSVPGTTLTLARATTPRDVIVMASAGLVGFLAAAAILAAPLARPLTNRRQRRPRGGALWCLIAIVVTGWGTIGLEFLNRRTSLAIPWDLFYLVGLAVVILTVPALIEQAVRRASKRMFERSLQTGAAATIALRREGHYGMSGLAARLGTLVMIAGLLQVWVGMGMEQAQAAAQGAAKLTSHVAIMRPNDTPASRPHLARLLAGLDANVGVVALVSGEEYGAPTVLASAAVLARLGLAPGSYLGEGMPSELRWSAILPEKQVQVKQVDLGACLATPCEQLTNFELLFVALDGGELEIAALNDTLRRYGVPNWHIVARGAEWIAGVESARNLGGMLLAGAGAAAITLALAMWLSALAGLRKTLAGLWPALVVIAGEKLLWRCAMWFTAFPVAVGAAVALAVNAIMVSVLKLLVVGVPEVITFTALGCLAALGLTVLGAWVTVRQLTARTTVTRGSLERS